MTVRIAQISDTHLSRGRPFFIGNFERIADDLRLRKPDIVINSGDLSLDGADVEDDLAFAADAHAGLAAEVHMIPGNHDVGDHVDVATRQPATAERLARYRRVIGEDFWTVDVPGWRIIGVNALILGTGQNGDLEQIDMIRRQASTCMGRELAIVLHKPLADESYNEQLTCNRFMTASPRGAIIEALSGVLPAVVLCGHVHQYRDTIIAGSRHLWAPATSFIISDPWQPGYGAKAIGYVEHYFDADGRHRHRLRTVRGVVHNDLVDFPKAYGDVRSWGPNGA